jgi:hypothetical protein
MFRLVKTARTGFKATFQRTAKKLLDTKMLRSGRLPMGVAPEPPVVYRDQEDSRQRDGETLEEYQVRVPLSFRPTADTPKLNYLGKPYGPSDDTIQ